MTMDWPERVRCFDEYVESVDKALHDPLVANKLGFLATSILDANNNAVLPNMRCGQMTIPKEYIRATNSAAIVPVSIDEAANAQYLVQPIHDATGVFRKMRTRVTSSVSRVSVDTEHMIRWLMSDTASSPKGLKRASAANTSAGFAISDDDLGGRFFSSSLPVLVIKADLLRGLNYWNQAATVGHEELHGYDINCNPILYRMPIGRAGSELAACHVSDVLFSMTDQPAAPRQFAHEVEQWRQQNMTQEMPFAPNRDQLSALRDWLHE